MRFVELSFEESYRESFKLAEKISQSFSPDVIVYLAKGGYIFGRNIAAFFGAPVFELSSKRSGDEIKRKNAALLMKLPRCARRVLREIEIRLRLNKKNEEQKQQFYLTSRYEPPASANKILLIDDSADSGSSIVTALEFLKELYPYGDVRIAALNVFDAAMQKVKIDYFTYRNTLISTPASKDNKQYHLFIEMYEKGEMPSNASTV